jgi:hypothetical protein
MRIAVLLLVLAACGTRGVGDNQPSPASDPDTVEIQPEVELSEDVSNFLALLQRRMSGHSTLPDAEVLMCLLGHVAGNIVYVNRVHPPLQRDTFTIWRDTIAPALMHAPCEQPDYLGTVHSHPAGPWGDGCWFSPGDLFMFAESKRDLLMMVTCTQGANVALMSRVKRGYSKREKR